MSVQYGFYIDSSRCTGCHACEMACRDKNNSEPGENYRTVSETRGGGFAPSGDSYAQNVFAYWTSIACNHCDHPGCVKACPTNAMHKREEDGIVLVDHDRCIGCKFCHANCPYRAPKFSEELGKTVKCDLCIDLVKQNKLPACVDACPFGCIEFGEIEDLRAKYGNLADISNLPSSKITNPNLVIRPHAGAIS